MEKRHMLCAALLILGSVTISGQKPEADVASVLGYPEQIYYNAKVVTMDDPGFNANPGTIAQAFAVRGDKILAIGTTAQIRRLAGPNTRQMDLKGRTVMPSFILTHEHPTDWAWTEPSALVHVFPEGNPNMVVRFLKGTADEQKANWEVALKEAVSTAKPKQWILLSSDWGGNFENMPGLANSFEQLVTTKRLDELAPNNPVRVKNSWITGKFNTRAMEEVRKIYPDAQLEGRGNRSEAGRQFEPDVMLYHKVALNADLLKAEIQDPVKGPRRLPEERNVLLEKHVDAAQEHAAVADVAFVGAGGRVGRDQQDVVPSLDERRCERIVAQATAAVHVAGAGRDVRDSHAPPRLPKQYNTPSCEPITSAPCAAAGDAGSGAPAVNSHIFLPVTISSS